MKFCANRRFLKTKKKLQTHQLARQKRLKRLKQRHFALAERRSAWFIAQQVY